MPRLQVLNGKRQGATFDVGRGETVVGHRNTANVAIDDPWVSWDHARIFFQGDSFWVEDLGSTNGTYVNCVRVKRERLSNEDIIFFGKTHVMFTAPELARAAAGTEPPDKERSDFELNVEALAAAAEQWAAPKGPRGAPADGGARLGSVEPSGSVGPAIPVPADELTDPLGLAGFPLKPLPDATDSGVGFADEPSANRDPFRPGADPRWPSSQGGVANRASPALDPDADPFGSARANADPFAAGGDDPFAQPRGQRAFADTHIDDTGGDSATARAGDLGDFEIDDRDDAAFADGPVAPASAAEVKKLLNREGSGEGAVDDLRALLGDAAARTPQPFKPPRLDPRADAGTSPSEPDPGAWTAPRGAAPVGPGSGKHALPPRGAPVTPIAPQDGFQQHESTWTQPPGVLPGAELMPPAVPATLPEGAGELAFEVAKLRDEARRVKLALEAVRQADPEKVRIAVLALRDQELGRQAREIAELRRELALLHEEMGKRQAELDLVTEDMITKEDTIDELSTRLEQLDPSFRRPGVSRDSPSPPSTALASGEANEDLKNLEF